MNRSDNGNGTFTNPVIFADYPDPDIIRVGEDFYLASSSFTDAPGIPICHSRDLVNWELIGHVYQRLPEMNPAYSMANGQVAYRGGTWAPSLRVHNGKFYVAMNTPAEGFFLFVSERPEGPYEMRWFGGLELYDPGLFFDDDGKAYVFHGADDIFITELAEDLRGTAGRARHLYSSCYGQPLEGAHAYKREGWYYVCQTCRGYNGIQIVYRSEHLLGPYESLVICADDMNYAGAGLHQGGFVELQNGETWFFMFQDRDYVGRVPVLQPVTWIDGWPMVGDPKNFGRAVVTWKKPAVQSEPVKMKMDRGDHFDNTTLGLHWQWNHNPDDSAWSLSERPGHLRIASAFAPDLLHARNTLTQKVGGGGCVATIQLDVSALCPSDRAGICVLGFPHAYLAVEDHGNGRRLVMVNNGHPVAESNGNLPDRLQLRAEADAEGMAYFSYSTDNGATFARLGNELVMQFSVRSFLGNKFGLFCFNPDPKATAFGKADFDSYDYQTHSSAGNCYSALSKIHATNFDFAHGVQPHRRSEKQPHQFLVNIHDGDWVRFDRIDFKGGAERFEVLAYGASGEVAIELRLDDLNGKLLGRCPIKGIGSQNQWILDWKIFSCSLLAPVKGVHCLYLRFIGGAGALMRLDWFQFQ